MCSEKLRGTKRPAEMWDVFCIIENSTVSEKAKMATEKGHEKTDA